MQRIRQCTAWALLGATCLYLLSGFGITYFRIVTPLTLGIMDKSNSLRIHDNLIYFFLPLLVLHVILTILRKLKCN